jgi:hypothetical protein
MNVSICIEINCDNEQVVNVDNETCPYECIYDRFDKKCRSSCSLPNYYEEINKICRLRPCNERKSNGNYSDLCGIGCIFNSTNDECQFVCYINDEELSSNKNSNNSFYIIIIIVIVIIMIIIVGFVVIIIVINKKRCKNSSIEIEEN